MTCLYLRLTIYQLRNQSHWIDPQVDFRDLQVLYFLKVYRSLTFSPDRFDCQLHHIWSRLPAVLASFKFKQLMRVEFILFFPFHNIRAIGWKLRLVEFEHCIFKYEILFKDSAWREEISLTFPVLQSVVLDFQRRSFLI